ncbi:MULTISPECIES: hypothetical protein [unclassified Methylophaga]|jgi:hypothetical protein|uniref:hypothetical protein n=1 Tax=unclassified Methylophaga TaxID=2629249 RepID=UPI000C8FC22A|nr:MULTISPECIES: hypothetical protein [unclassified Methylophaga]MAP25454.1 hypothetical protein [Methylophaga sp.]MAP28368.1 hypothetical protein [Methylophaga sp.]HBX60548.1 hypothetical protein [Methylophaga sp.]|tara:strand:- start:4333 stop:4635 length:303 start_codon:yes stop_codon:yes gene_type:complete
MKTKMNSCKFEEQTKPVMIELLDLKKRFRETELTDDCMTKIYEIEKKEHEVLVAWAISTKEINPTMLREVVKGQCRYTPKKEDYLIRVLEIDTNDEHPTH